MPTWLRRLIPPALGIVLLLAWPATRPGPSSTYAEPATQDTPCEQIVRTAMQQVGSACSTLGTNELCYGNNDVQAFDLELAAIDTFSERGDRLDLNNVTSVTTAAYNPLNETWGVALLSVQADLPDAADERLTFVLLGGAALFDDTTLAPPPVTCTAINQTASNINIRSAATTDSAVLGQVGSAGTLTATGRTADGWLRVDFNGETAWTAAEFFRVDCAAAALPEVTPDSVVVNNPMQVVRLATGNSACESAPSGLLIQSPSGRQTTITVNGVEMVFASAGFISANLDGSLDVTGIAGEITLRATRGNRSAGLRDVLEALSELRREPTTFADTVRNNLFTPTLGFPPQAAADSDSQEEEALGETGSVGEGSTGDAPTAIEPGPLQRTVAPGLTSRVRLDGQRRIVDISAPEIAPNLGIIPALLDVAVNGVAFDDAVLQSTGDITQVESLLARQACVVGQVLSVDLPVPDTDIDPVLGITFPAGDQGVVLASRRARDTLQITCLAEGTQVIVISVAAENDDTLALGLIVEVTATPPPTATPAATPDTRDDDDDDDDDDRDDSDDVDDRDDATREPDTDSDDSDASNDDEQEDD